MHLVLNGWFYNKPFTGSGQYLHNLLNQFPIVAPEIKVTLVTPDDVTLEPHHASRLTPYSLRSSPSNFGKLKFEQLDFPNACQKLKADLAHIPYWAPPLSSPVPFVVTVHDLIPILIPEYNRSLKVRLYNALVSAATPGAAHIITDSDSSTRDVIRYLKVAADKVSTVHLAVGSDYKPSPNFLTDVAVRQKYNLPDAYVLYLGGFQPHKNVRNILEAWTWCDGPLGEGYPLVIAGKLPEPSDHFYEDLPGYAKELDLEYVHFVGAIAEEDKPVVYRGAAAFVFPSRYEGFGLPLLEALACGVPVITTAAASIPEVVGEAAYLVENPDDTRALGAAIIAVVVNPDVVDRLTGAAREQVKKFSWEKTAQATVAVYHRALVNKSN
jgi:glycosyltransferase involved in cell wall biosynthesis